jgi:transposase-like protein
VDSTNNESYILKAERGFFIMGRTSHYSQAVRIQAVKDYESGKKSSREIALKLGCDQGQIIRWKNAMTFMGKSVFDPKPRNKTYPREVKLAAIKAYKRGEGSLADITNRYGILSTQVLRGWIDKYNNHREIRDSNPKGEIYMIKTRKTTQQERQEIVSYCMANEQSYKLTAERYCVAYSQVYVWVKKYREQGEAGLADRRGHRKAESELSVEEKQVREIKKLEAKLALAKMENELLKKVAKIERKLYSERYGKKQNI